MATKKRSGNKQPADDPTLKQAAKQEAETDASTGNEATLSEPPVVSINVGLDPDELHLHDSRS